MSIPRTNKLGELVAKNVSCLTNLRSWRSFIQQVRPRSCLAEGVSKLPHPAAPFLEKLRTVGAPVQFESSDWTPSRIEQAVNRGSHPSTRDYLGFLEEDMADYGEKSYWCVLPLDSVRDLEGLRISPLGVVPQRDRRPRTIVDYSFSEVNQETVHLAPPEAMQFGRALDRVLYHIFIADTRHGPVYLLKVDLSDGFYRIAVRAQDIPKLGVVFPVEAGEPPLVAFPMTLPMGWTESPPYFSTATETVADLANAHAFGVWDPPRHPMEEAASTPAPPDWGTPRIDVPPPPAGAPTDRVESIPSPRKKPRPNCPPIRYADVYVDDEILAAQGTPAQLNRFRRQLLHINDQVFRPNDQRDKNRKQPVSEKKLGKGDACWSTRKVILGWLVDTLAMTIELPPHRRQRLVQILEETKEQRRISKKECHRVLGELRSMMLAIPGGPGLLSNLQEALTASANSDRVRLTAETRRQLHDLHVIALDVANRPTRIAELFPANDGHYFGACDAAKAGFGGVLLPGEGDDFAPMAWRLPLPPDLQQEVISWDNPRGTITNSDLELAGTILQEAVIATHVRVTERTVHTCCDNTPSVAWRGKGSITTRGAAAALLRLASLQQRRLRHLPRIHYIPGVQNTLADMASQPFLDNASPAARHRFLSDLRLAEKAAKHSVSRDRSRSAEKTWTRCWLPFLGDIGISDPYLRGVPDKIPILRVFAQRLRTGELSRSGLPVRAPYVRDQVLYIATAFTDLGLSDPRLTHQGTMDPRLSRQYRAYHNADPAPKRVKPIPIQIVHRVRTQAAQQPSDASQATSDMTGLGFFYLLRPGEHCRSHYNTPLCLRDVALLIGNRPLPLFTTPFAELELATHSSLTFDEQKNRRRGETVAHASSTHPEACPTKTLIRRVTYLRQHGATPDTPLCAYRSNNRWHFVSSKMITTALRAAAATLPSLGFRPDDVSARSLRSGGAMALLCGRVDRNVIELVGRWRSDAIHRYLHAQALPIIASLARTMLQHGAFTLAPGADVPAHAQAIIQAADAAAG